MVGADHETSQAVIKQPAQARDRQKRQADNDQRQEQVEPGDPRIEPCEIAPGALAGREQTPRRQRRGVMGRGRFGRAGTCCHALDPLFRRPSPMGQRQRSMESS